MKGKNLMAGRGIKKAGSFSSEEREGIRKVPTHIAGLDDILNGGFPEGRTTLLLVVRAAARVSLGWSSSTEGLWMAVRAYS